MTYVSPEFLGIRVFSALFLALWFLACSGDPTLRPDEVLELELGFTNRDQVHRIIIRGGGEESASPVETEVTSGGYVEFVTADWFVHEVVFELDSLSPAARTFLERTDQVASPPLIRQDSRYVMDFSGGPSGRYPFLLKGNGASGRGVVVVIAGT